jgi:hypothetical protein
MFLRHKRIGKYTYVYLVESVYEDGRTRQHIIRNLGRREDVEAGGDLERLAASAARLSRKALVLSAEARGAAPVLGCRRIGPGLIFERLWRETGCRAVIEKLAEGRKFGFAVERAVFLTVLHRLMVSGSDRAANKWRADCAVEGADGLRLHQLYRTMAWLGDGNRPHRRRYDALIIWQVSEVSSPLKKAPLTELHPSAKPNAAKAVSPSSETMTTI